MLKKRSNPEPYNPSVINLEDVELQNQQQLNKERNSSSKKIANVSHQSIKIETHKDIEMEEQIRSFTNDISSAKTFNEKRVILNKIFRKANMTKKAGHVHRFLIFQLVSEFSCSNSFQSKNFALTMLKRAFGFCTNLEYDFKKTLIETIMLHLEIEESNDQIVLLLNILSTLIDQTHIDDFMKYHLIEILHSLLWSECLKTKENSMKSLLILCKKSEFDFLLIFENLIERCNEGSNEDMIIIFLKNLEGVNLNYLPDKLSNLIIDMTKNPLFSTSKDCKLHLLSFFQNIVLSMPQVSNDFNKAIFIYVCKNLRDFYSEIRKKS